MGQYEAQDSIVLSMSNGLLFPVLKHDTHPRIASVPSRKMVVSLPCCGGGRGGCGCGRGGPPFRDRERNPRLVSNLSNTSLAVSVSRLPPA